MALHVLQVNKQAGKFLEDHVEYIHLKHCTRYSLFFHFPGNGSTNLAVFSLKPSASQGESSLKISGLVVLEELGNKHIS